MKREKIAANSVGFIFSVVMPALASAMSPSLSLGVGLPAILFSVLVGVAILVWVHSEHANKSWRAKLLPICCMIAGSLIFCFGGYVYYEIHKTNEKVENTPKLNQKRPLNMWELFDTDFPGIGRTMMTTSVSIAGSSPVSFQIATYWDIPTNSYFFAMYFPKVTNIYTLVFEASNSVSYFVSMLNQAQIEINTPGDTRRTTLEQMNFSNQVYIYVEDDYDVDQLEDIQEAYRKFGYTAHTLTDTYRLLHQNELDRDPKRSQPSLPFGTAEVRLPNAVDGMTVSVVNVPLVGPPPTIINHLVRTHPSPAHNP